MTWSMMTYCMNINEDGKKSIRAFRRGGSRNTLNKMKDGRHFSFSLDFVGFSVKRVVVVVVPENRLLTVY
jgi:hypothetical protein